MSFARRLLAPVAAGALAVAATGLMAGTATAAESGPGSVTCNGNDYDATYGAYHVSSDDVDCAAAAAAAQAYGMDLARSYGAPVR